MPKLSKLDPETRLLNLETTLRGVLEQCVPIFADVIPLLRESNSVALKEIQDLRQRCQELEKAVVHLQEKVGVS
jgi:hypothetical protein